MIRIIIADDHPIVLQALKKTLQEEFPSVHIEEAADTTALLERVGNESWDLVISDLAMPGGGGLIALRKIKQLKKNLPVLIISTYPSEQYRSSAIKAGAEDFISKDSFPGELVQAVRRILDK
jgi:two-component system, NarL family, invasion response regulator UvrY